jgi:sulfide:quinone oxidoreductase
MKKILILGAGTAGSMMANKLVKAKNNRNYEITIVDNNHEHYYQPGFLFIPFGTYKKQDVVKPVKNFIPKKATYIVGEIKKIEATENKVFLTNGVCLEYDFLIIASGAKLAPEETPGLLGKLWNKEIFEFYTMDGSLVLYEKLKNWKGGKFVVSFVDLPFKCPIAPLEYLCLADAYFTQKGLRNKVEIIFVTPLSGAFTKPVATKILDSMLEEKGIKVIPDFYIERIDEENKKMISYDEREVPFDILTIVPLNKGADFIGHSGLGDDLNFVPVNKNTLQHEQYPNIFAIGDAAALPTSKAGSVAHFAADILFENITAIINGKEPKAFFDGHANCFIETGYGKATLLDFNYETEPLPGVFPLPKIGPFKLLGISRFNHWGKLFFKWIYWNILITGKHLPMIHSNMSIKGKNRTII